MSAETTVQLIERCARGDAEAWNELVNRHSRLVYSVPRRYGFAPSDCDDVHQAVFSALVSNIAKMRNPQGLPQWLITTAHRESWRIGRARGRALNTDTDFVSVSDPAESLVEEVEERQLVRRALEELGGKCKELLEKLFGRSGSGDYERVASELGIPMGSIGPTRSRCLDKLGVILQKMGIRAPGATTPRERRGE